MRSLALLVALVALGHAEPAAPPVRVIVNAKNPLEQLDRRFVAEAFLKKRTRWDDDTAIQPVDLGQHTSERIRFSHEVLERDVASVRRYWAQQVFSGRGVPPPELSSDADVVRYVAAHPGGIGYVAQGVALAGVKIVEVE
jgi:ABC-type phosphate transport system substrate-binding protein